MTRMSLRRQFAPFSPKRLEHMVAVADEKLDHEFFRRAKCMRSMRSGTPVRSSLTDVGYCLDRFVDEDVEKP